MAILLKIHPDNPQLRLVRRAVEIVRSGGVIAYPTDSTYALGCHLEDKEAVDRIRAIRRLDKHHHMTLMCRDLSSLSTYAHVDNATFRALKRHLPGPFTFLLRASREVPRRLVHPKRKTIGLRVPDHAIAGLFLAELGEPMMSTTLIPPGDELPLTDADIIDERIGKTIDVIIDGGPGGLTPTTVIDLTEGDLHVVRPGAGALA